MEKPDELIIKGYTCPLCGGQVYNASFYTKRFSDGVWWLLDQTPCCNVCLAWLPIDGVLIYVGTFRNEERFVQWDDSAGQYSHWLAAGRYWDHNAQGPTSDIDEIPF